MKRSYATFLVVLLAIVLNAVVSAQTAKPVLAVLNKADNNLALVDPVTMKVTAKIPVGDGPHEVVFSTDGKLAFVANYGAQSAGSTISVIDVAAAKELRRVDISPLMRPHGLHFVGGKLYFTAETNRMIARYDPAANKVDWMMGTGQNGSHMVAVSSDQKRIVTANIGSDTVTVFDLQNVPPAPSKVTQIPVGKQPEAVDLSPDDKEVWTGLNAEGMVEIVDVAAGKSVAKLNIGGRPYRVRFTPDGKKVVLTMVPTKEILVIDAATRKEIKRLKVDGTPLGVAFSNDGSTIFVTVAEPHSTLKIDLEKLEITGRVETGTVPDGIAIFGL